MKWEYMVVYMPFGSTTVAETFNQFGDDGWELVGVDSGWCVFKRKKTATRKAKK